MNAARAEQIMEALAKLYPEARPELNFSNPFETLIATILSAQCTDKRSCFPRIRTRLRWRSSPPNSSNP